MGQALNAAADKPPVYSDPFGLNALASRAAGLVRKAGEAAVSVVLPNRGPAGEAATQAIKATGAGAQSIGVAVGGAVKSAAAGIKTGTTLVVVAVLGILALWIMGPVLGSFRGGNR